MDLFTHPFSAYSQKALIAFGENDIPFVYRELGPDPQTMADCAAAPSLFYADWTHAIDPAFVDVHAYRKRLLARPSFAKLVDDARPFRSWFPPGAGPGLINHP